MYTLTTLSLFESRTVRILFLTISLCWMSFYPIYRNYYNGLGIEQYERHKNFLAHNSMFFNPWQYRILCPMLIEGSYWLADNTIYRLVDLGTASIKTPDNSGEKNIVTQKLVAQSGNPEFIKYNIIFVLFRFAQHLLIFWLAFRYFSGFVKNQFLNFFGLVFIALIMGNTVADSDLSFNTYADVILYLALGIVIVESRSKWWVLLLTILGAFNRETSLLIPVLYFVSQLDFADWPDLKMMLLKQKSVIALTASSLILFSVIFFAIRYYYGYQPPTVWRVPAGFQMLKLNLFSSVSVKTYNEMFGVFGVLPVLVLFMFRSMSPLLIRFFIVLVPVWFGIHFWSVVSYQSRLFLVPTLLIFLPATLAFIEAESKRMLAGKT